MTDYERMKEQQAEPEPQPIDRGEDVTEEQLWSWIDRDAPELEDHLERFPTDRERVAELRKAIRVATSGKPDRIPSRIGPYPIHGRLGQGGMGVVFEASQTRPDRRVALKVIRGAWLDDERTQGLFHREVEILARLQHPGIATIFDAGETKEGAPYFVMELVRGEPLDAWARRGQPEPRVLSVAEEIARAVHHAHARGVVHRDLKPSNVYVEEGSGQVKVLDFGLARIIDPDAGSSLTAAVSGKVIGTVRYMSPEQARGLSSRVTSSSDVYSIGVLLYEMIVGAPPHDFEGKGLFECAREVAEVDARRPSELRPGIAPDLEAVMCKALARDPEQRYATALELADELRQLRLGEPVKAPLFRPAREGTPSFNDWKELAAGTYKQAIREAKHLGAVTTRHTQKHWTDWRQRRGTKSRQTVKEVKLDLNPAIDAIATGARVTASAAKTAAAGATRAKQAIAGRMQQRQQRERPKPSLFRRFKRYSLVSTALVFVVVLSAHEFELDETIRWFATAWSGLARAINSVLNGDAWWF